MLIAAAAYELTPAKRHFRRRCRAAAGSGLRYGLHCAGSSIGLMAILVALDVMSLFWMAVVAVLACAQKLGLRAGPGSRAHTTPAVTTRTRCNDKREKCHD